jgi:anti-sigma regulatory factor (Ser/Thr protein kinase)
MRIMCRVVSIALPGSTRSPGQARAWTRTWLDSWDVADDGVTTLLVSELVTNAVQYTRARTTLTLAVAAGMIEVGVTDNGPRDAMISTRGGSEPSGAEVLSESGRGLIIVEALAHDWGVSANGTGKQVWFRRPVGADWPHTATCVCRTDNPTGRLASGRDGTAVHRPWHHQTPEHPASISMISNSDAHPTIVQGDEGQRDNGQRDEESYG